jgi:5'-nucleotidase/UDP-sugar diphosphatase
MSWLLVIMLTGAGSIRIKEMGPLITLKDAMTCFPYDDTLNRHIVSGLKIKKMFAHFMRKENRNGEGECYQVNKKVKAVYDDTKKELVLLDLDGDLSRMTRNIKYVCRAIILTIQKTI